MTNRRDFIVQAAAAGGLLALQGQVVARAGDGATARPQPLKILILGGTGNTGPYFVNAALARGHRVAVFSRGKGKTDLPDGVEQLLGDRNGDLASITNRDWDAVIDVATFVPDWVKSLGEAIKERAKHYLFISTVSVYDHPELNDRTREHSQVLERGTTKVEKYGADKVLSEREAERQFAGRTAILRPGYIVGPGDRIGFLAFWPLRMQKGGEVMVAGDALLPFQCIDVRDLAQFAVHLVEKRATGIFNTMGPATATTLGQMIEAAKVATASTAKVIWVPAARVAAQQDKEVWSKSLFWSWYSESIGQSNIMRMSNERALAQGLSLRPLVTTLTDTLQWYSQQPAETQAMMAPGYKKPPADTETPSAQALWNRYLQREQEVLAQWRAESPELSRLSRSHD